MPFRVKNAMGTTSSESAGFALSSVPNYIIDDHTSKVREIVHKLSSSLFVL